MICLAYGQFRATCTCIGACACIDWSAVKLLPNVVESMVQMRATTARYCTTVVYHTVPEL